MATLFLVQACHFVQQSPFGDDLQPNINFIIKCSGKQRPACLEHSLSLLEHISCGGSQLTCLSQHLKYSSWAREVQSFTVPLQ